MQNKDSDTIMETMADSLMSNMCINITNGTLLSDTDDNMVKLVLESIFNDKEYFTSMGVTIGVS